MRQSKVRELCVVWCVEMRCERRCEVRQEDVMGQCLSVRVRCGDAESYGQTRCRDLLGDGVRERDVVSAERWRRALHV